MMEKIKIEIRRLLSSCAKAQDPGKEKHMSRIKLTLPDQYIFSTELIIQINHINYGGHLGNDAVLSLVHEARVRFLAHFGYSEMDIEGYGLIIADAVLVYKSQGFWQDKITISIAVEDFSKHGCDFFYKLINDKTKKDLAYVKTNIVIYDYQQQKLVESPPAFKEKLLQAKPISIF